VKQPLNNSGSSAAITSPDGVVAWHAVPAAQEVSKEGQVLHAPALDLGEVIRPRHRRAEQ
jgi:hypothetical protein